MNRFLFLPYIVGRLYLSKNDLIGNESKRGKREGRRKHITSLHYLLVFMVLTFIHKILCPNRSIYTIIWGGGGNHRFFLAFFTLDCPFASLGFQFVQVIVSFVCSTHIIISTFFPFSSSLFLFFVFSFFYLNCFYSFSFLSLCVSFSNAIVLRDCSFSYAVCMRARRCI